MESRRKILIVEDEPFLIDLYRKAFNQKGYLVLEAMDGEDGLNKARSEKPELVLLDIMLPKMDGISVLKSLKEDGSLTQKIPVYLLTNLGQESVIREAFKIGATGYILKSKYLPHQVVEEIDKYFSGKI